MAATDKNLRELIKKLKKHKEKFYKVLVRSLSSARRKRTKNLSVCAWSFSKAAEKKIKESGKIVSWNEIIEKNIKGRIVV